MTLDEAFKIASRWVETSVSALPGFRGAFLHGSACYLHPGEQIPELSDVDVVVVRDELAAEPNREKLGEPKPGKMRHSRVVLDVSYVSEAALGSAEDVLANHVWAGSVARGLIVSDPDHLLAPLHESVAARFSRPEWIAARCESALEKSRRTLHSFTNYSESYDQALSLLFGLGMQTHVVLVAACLNPTVRSRYEAVAKLLAQRRMPQLHERLLRLLGSAEMQPARVRGHLNSMILAYDRAAAIPDADPKYANHVNSESRHSAVDGTRRSIDEGLHREAMFWISSCFAKSLGILHGKVEDEEYRNIAAPFTNLLADLRIETATKRRRRRDQALAFATKLRKHAESLSRADRPSI